MRILLICCLGVGLVAGCAAPAPSAEIDRDPAESAARAESSAVSEEADKLEALALRTAGDHLSVPVAALEVARISPVEWRDSSLGCPQPGRSYMQVITPGHLALIRHGGQTWRVHMANGRGFVCERDAKKDFASKQPLLELRLSQAELETRAASDLARRLSVPEEEVSVRETRPVVWQDESIGCGAPAASRSAGRSKGYVIELVHQDRVYTYHADLRRVVPCPPIDSH
ncbi:hypothetical protein BH24PSE2_BH24PSE2_19770 [soil metagenome]